MILDYRRGEKNEQHNLCNYHWYNSISSIYNNRLQDKYKETERTKGKIKIQGCV